MCSQNYVKNRNIGLNIKYVEYYIVESVVGNGFG